MAKRGRKPIYTLTSGRKLSDRQRKQITYYEKRLEAERQRITEKYGDSLKTYRKYASDDDIIFRPAKLKRPQFENVQQVTAYINRLRKATERGSEARRIYNYRENYIKAVARTYGRKEAQNVSAVLPYGEKFAKLLLDPLNRYMFEIGFMYYDPDVNKLTTLYQYLGYETNEKGRVKKKK